MEESRLAKGELERFLYITERKKKPVTSTRVWLFSFHTPRLRKDPLFILLPTVLFLSFMFFGSFHVCLSIDGVDWRVCPFFAETSEETAAEETLVSHSVCPWKEEKLACDLTWTGRQSWRIRQWGRGMRWIYKMNYIPHSEITGLPTFRWQSFRTLLFHSRQLHLLS